MSNPALNLANLSLLRALPASTEPPVGLTREQQARAEDLPWGLIRGGRRTELGDYVLTLVEERDTALRGKHAAEMRRDEAVAAGHTTARLLDDCAATLETERTRADALQARLNALAAPAPIDLDELQRQNERWTAALEHGDPEAARAAQAYLAGAAAALLRVVVQQGARIDAILAPVEGVDLEEVLRLAATPARSFSAAEDRDATLSYAAPILVREVARLRVHQQEAHDRDQRHCEEIEALTADLDEAHKMLREGLLAGPLVTGRTEDGVRIRDHLLGWLFTGFAAELERSDAPNNLSFSVTPDEQHPYSGYRMDLSIARPDHPCISDQNARLREEIEEVRRVLGYFAGDGSEEFIPTTPLGSTALDLLATKTAEATELRLTLAAEQGKPEGAPSEGWVYSERDWSKTYPDGSFAAVHGSRGRRRWMRAYWPDISQPPNFLGRGLDVATDRAGMIAADKALE